MRILWYGDSPWLSTAYGKIARILLPELAKRGVEIIIQTKFGHYGRPVELDYGILYGVVDENYNIDNIPVIAKAHDVDMIVMMADLWAYDLKKIKEELNFIPIVFYYPLDTEEIPANARHQLENYVDYVVPMSEHSKIMVKKILPEDKVLDTIYPPIPTDVFDIDENVTRFDMGFKDYDILFGMVQMNKDIVRKDQMRQLYALKKAIDIVKGEGIDKKVGVYCHMLYGGKGTSFNLKEFAEQHGLIDDVQYPIPEAYLMGVKDKMMSQIYNGIDVLIQCTSGEGFGMPTAEAMLCGTPVFGALNSSTKELVELSRDNIGISCDETLFLSPSIFRIARFDEMVEKFVQLIKEGVRKFDKSEHRKRIESRVNPVNVANLWFKTLGSIMTKSENSCMILPDMGRELIKNIEITDIVAGRRTH